MNTTSFDAVLLSGSVAASKLPAPVSSVNGRPCVPLLVPFAPA
jgi:hypothetical protein